MSAVRGVGRWAVGDLPSGGAAGEPQGVRQYLEGNVAQLVAGQEQVADYPKFLCRVFLLPAGPPDIVEGFRHCVSDYLVEELVRKRHSL